MRGSRFRRFEVAGSQGLRLSGFRAAVTNRWFHPPTQPTQTFFANCYKDKSAQQLPSGSKEGNYFFSR